MAMASANGAGGSLSHVLSPISLLSRHAILAGGFLATGRLGSRERFRPPPPGFSRPRALRRFPDFLRQPDNDTLRAANVSQRVGVPVPHGRARFSGKGEFDNVAGTVRVPLAAGGRRLCASSTGSGEKTRKATAHGMCLPLYAPRKNGHAPPHSADNAAEAQRVQATHPSRVKAALSRTRDIARVSAGG